MTDSKRRTGRTTNMLLAAMAFSKKNPVLIVAANQQQVGNLKHHYAQLGGNPNEVVFLNGADKRGIYERTRGMRHVIILNDHYAVEAGNAFYGEMYNL